MNKLPTNWLRLTIFLFVQLALSACQSTVKGETSEGSNNQPSEFYSVNQLVEQGLILEKLNPKMNLLCSSENPDKCVCLEQMPCEGENNCTNFNDDITDFKTALTSESGISCRHASVGHCGEFKYFQFNGAIKRRDMLWYSAQGTLVGLRRATDYPAYCNGSTNTIYYGNIPKCAFSVQDEHICGNNWSHGLNPLQTLGLEPINNQDRK